MPTVFHCQIEMGSEGLQTPMLRYGLLQRLAASARSRDVTVLAFGLGDRELRLVLDGDDDDLYNTVRGVKSGTSRAARSWDHVLFWGDTERRRVPWENVADEIAWCHAVGPDPDPLASPWTSHRDLLGYRQADFHDAAPALQHVDPLEVHRLAGGGPLPRLIAAAPESGLQELLRVAAAVLGVLPANRRCFRLFVHLARAHGWRTTELASALMLTGRRIRQLSQGDEPLLPLAMVHLGDDRLAVVP